MIQKKEEIEVLKTAFHRTSPSPEIQPFSLIQFDHEESECLIRVVP